MDETAMKFRDLFPAETLKSPATIGQVVDLLDASLEGDTKGLKVNLDAIRERISKLEASAVSTDKLEIVLMKITELERMYGSLKRHNGNLESRVTKLDHKGVIA